LAVPIAGDGPVVWAPGEGTKAGIVAQEVLPPPAPVSLSGDKGAKADGEAPRDDVAVTPERALSPQGQVDVAQTSGRNIEGNGPVEGPVTTKAERIWLGLLQWSEAGAEMARMGRGDGMVGAPILGSGPVFHGIEVPSQVLAAPQGQASGAAALAMPELMELVLREIDLAAFAGSPQGQPFLTGGPATGALPAATVPQLALGIVAQLQQGADGKTEIALSPAELGSVRLRLETDARDPDRIIVHFAFDRPETMDLFRRHADQLTEAMRAAGYAEARLDFGQHGPAGEGGRDASGRNAADDDMAEPTNPRAAHQLPNATPSYRLAAAVGLDLRL
jgi:hypothetical protein